MEMSTVAQHRCKADTLHTPFLDSRSCCLPKRFRLAKLHRRKLQRTQPQAIALDGLAPADLHTELEALERSQGASQVCTAYLQSYPLYHSQLACDPPMYASQAEANVQTELLTLSEAQQIAVKR